MKSRRFDELSNEEQDIQRKKNREQHPRLASALESFVGFAGGLAESLIISITSQMALLFFLLFIASKHQVDVSGLQTLPIILLYLSRLSLQSAHTIFRNKKIGFHVPVLFVTLLSLYFSGVSSDMNFWAFVATSWIGVYIYKFIKGHFLTHKRNPVEVDVIAPPKEDGFLEVDIEALKVQELVNKE